MTMSEFQSEVAKSIDGDLSVSNVRQYALLGLGASVGMVQMDYARLFEGQMFSEGAVKIEIASALKFIAMLCDMNEWDMEEIGRLCLKMEGSDEPFKED